TAGNRGGRLECEIAPDAARGSGAPHGRPGGVTVDVGGSLSQCHGAVAEPRTRRDEKMALENDPVGRFLAVEDLEDAVQDGGPDLAVGMDFTGEVFGIVLGPV